MLWARKLATSAAPFCTTTGSPQLCVFSFFVLPSFFFSLIPFVSFCFFVLGFSHASPSAVRVMATSECFVSTPNFQLILILPPSPSPSPSSSSAAAHAAPATALMLAFLLAFILFLSTLFCTSSCSVLPQSMLACRSSSAQFLCLLLLAVPRGSLNDVAVHSCLSLHFPLSASHLRFLLRF